MWRHLPSPNHVQSHFKGSKWRTSLAFRGVQWNPIEICAGVSGDCYRAHYACSIICCSKALKERKAQIPSIHLERWTLAILSERMAFLLIKNKAVTNRWLRDAKDTYTQTNEHAYSAFKSSVQVQTAEEQHSISTSGYLLGAAHTTLNSFFVRGLLLTIGTGMTLLLLAHDLHAEYQTPQFFYQSLS